MAFINNSDKILIADPRVNTTYGGPDSLKKLQPWVGVGDLAMDSAEPLTFKWGTVGFIGSGVHYYGLEIDFNCLSMEPGVEYTLLMDRRRNSESKGIKYPGRRKNKYYHEQHKDAVINNRLSEFPITMEKGQVFDLKSDKYFKIVTAGGATNLNGAKGLSHGKKITKGLQRNYCNLGFRIRTTTKDGQVSETGILGTIAMVVTNSYNSQDPSISFAQPIS